MMKATILALLLAGGAMASIVPVSGSETYTTDSSAPHIDWTISFSGVDLISGDQVSVLGCSGSGPGIGTNCWGGFGAFIDGQHFSPGSFSFILGEAGSITGFDDQRHVVIVQAISAYSQMTSVSCTDEGHLCVTQFAITPFASVPEPSTWLLTAAGLGLLWRKVRD